MLTTEHLSLTIRGKPLLQDISLSLKPGEVLAVLGPNGAGKSTLLRLLSAELKPSQGKIMLNDKPLAAWSSTEQARLRAVLPQSSRLSFPFSAEEVVMMGRAPYRHSHTRHQNAQAVQAALQIAHVQHLAKRMFTSLSGGEQQRVQLARVLAQLWQADTSQTRYLLLDEPTSALDLAHQHHVLGLAQQLAKVWNLGVLAVLHDLNLAALYADQIAILKQGQLQTYGEPQTCLSPRQIHQAFAVDVEVMPYPLQVNRPLVITQRPPLTQFPTLAP
ncbi:MAG: heme ABC transporter ATP-binding protein [Thiothrix sp.]|nr:MAG: heme ABC transporter ATP-binding protein [Thiothrix sp.]